MSATPLAEILAERPTKSEESLDLAWRPIAEVALDADESMSRMARKWLARPQ